MRTVLLDRAERQAQDRGLADQPRALSRRQFDEPSARDGHASATDNAHEDAILAHKMVNQSRADMHGSNHRDRDSDDLVNGQQLLGKRSVLRPDRWKVEQTVDR